MDAQLRTIAERCRAGAYSGRMTFPEIVATLMAAGFDGYFVDYRSATTTYYLQDDASVVLGNEPTDGSLAAAFDAAGVAAEVRRAQENAPDYTYRGFCTRVKGHGCAGYLVSFPGRRVVYFGRTGEIHVEHFPT